MEKNKYKEETNVFLAQSLYPAILKDVTLRLMPEKKGVHLISDSHQTSVNADALEILKRSDGTKSIYDILKLLTSKGEADNKETQRQVITFLKDLEKKKFITLHRKRKKTKQNITIFDPSKIHYPYSLSIELTHKCNLRCAHCYARAGPEEKAVYIPTKKLLHLLNDLHKRGLMVVELTGGEPLLHPDFFTILDFCCTKFQGVSILTNGTLINKTIAEKIGKYHQVLFANISLDGSTPKNHDTIRGVQGAFNKTTQAIQLLSQQHIKIRVSMTTFPHSIYDIEKTLLLAKKLGASHFTFGPVIPFGRGQNIHWNIPKKEAEAIGKYENSIYEKYKNFLLAYKDDDPRMKAVEKRKNCGAGYERYAMSPIGTLRPCVLSDEQWFDLGNLFQESPEKIFNTPLISFFSHLQKPSKNRKSCRRCSYKTYCHPCWARGLNKNLVEGVNCLWFKQSGAKNYLSYKQLK